MSEQLTAFERALLGQLESLAKGSYTSLEASKRTSEQLQDLSKLLTLRISALEKRVEELEQREVRMLEVLNTQSELTRKWKEQSSILVKRVNDFLNDHEQ